MQTYTINNTTKDVILAVGPESAGNFSVFKNGTIYHSEHFGDLLSEDNFATFQKNILDFLSTKKITPNIILSDLHPQYKTTILAENLAKKTKSKHIKTQHHLAHVSTSYGENILSKTKDAPKDIFYGIAMDGTGYGYDGKIWGGEVFKLYFKNNILIDERIGHLENQILLGGELAIREPARMIISILNNFLTKEKIFLYIQKHYNQNQFNLLYSQLQQNFNCLHTSSTGRILDATSLLLGFCDNTRKYKHEPIAMLEKNSTLPFTLSPQLYTNDSQIILNTTCIFEFLIKNINKDKKRLAATAQLYLAHGFHEIIMQHTKQLNSLNDPQIFIGGGVSNNKIISDYFETKNGIFNKKIPRGDAGLSFGQIIYFLLTH